MAGKGPKRVAYRKREAQVKRRLRKKITEISAEVRRLNALLRAAGITVTKKRKKASGVVA